jgi:hypothetical protein
MLTGEMVKIPEMSSPPKPAKDKSSLYVEAATWKRLNEIAKDLGHSRNALVRGILRDWVADFEADKKKHGIKNQ